MNNVLNLFVGFSMLFALCPVLLFGVTEEAELYQHLPFKTKNSKSKIVQTHAARRLKVFSV